MQPTSLEAYKQLLKTTKPSHDAAIVLSVIRQHPVAGITDRETARLLNWEASRVSARRNELLGDIAQGIMPEVVPLAKGKCTITGKLAIHWAAALKIERQMTIEDLSHA